VGVRGRPRRVRHRCATLPAPLPGGSRRSGVPAAVRGRDRGVRPVARHSRAATGHHRTRRCRVHHARARPDAGARSTNSERRDDHMTAAAEQRNPTTTPLSQEETIESLGNYAFGWSDPDTAGASARRGLNEDVVTDISEKKSEPEWMRDARLKALKLFERKPMPNWGADLSDIDFDNIKYFVRSTEKQA